MARRYAWDEAKRRSNLDKHGLDFVDAWRVVEAPGRLVLETTRRGERRRQVIAAISTTLPVLSVAFVERGGIARVISFRRASRKERMMHDAWTQESH
ncbi:MAG: BrnT family toxin [Alphaproteobacteria bacterium]|nr:BrnT family toxin [Alphaproteobacteria bacterium]